MRKTSASNTMRLDAAKREHQATRGEMEVQARRAAKLDKKANILITGLQQRDTKLRAQLNDLAQQVRPLAQCCGHQGETPSSSAEMLCWSVGRVGTS
jgi:pre-mRNA-splicing factor CDC5/CEF1